MKLILAGFLLAVAAHAADDLTARMLDLGDEEVVDQLCTSYAGAEMFVDRSRTKPHVDLAGLTVRDIRLQPPPLAVLTGKDRGKRGVVERTLPAAGKIVVRGVNLHKKHTRAGQQKTRSGSTTSVIQGGIVDFESPLNYSNVMLVCPSCDRPTRIRHSELPDGNRNDWTVSTDATTSAPETCASISGDSSTPTTSVAPARAQASAKAPWLVKQSSTRRLAACCATSS